MKKLILNFSLTALIASTFFFSSFAYGDGNKVVNTIEINGKIYPLVNLPEVEVSASPSSKIKHIKKEQPDLLFENSAKIVMVIKYNEEYMPAVFLKEAHVIAERTDKTAQTNFRKAMNGFLGFMISIAFRLGIR